MTRRTYSPTRSTGLQSNAVRRPSDRINFNGRLDHALNTVAHAPREPAAERQRTGQSRRRRIRPRGARVLARRPTTRCCACRRAARGAGTSSASRACRSDGRRRPRRQMLEARTVRVLDTFTSGGAQQAGGRESTDIEWATNVDWARGKHAIRFGTLIEGGWYDSDNRTNYLGTFTFTSRADFDAGRPSNYTQRIGDPRVRVLALAGRPLHPGRLARSFEPDDQRRPASGAPDAPRRSC